MFKLKQQLVLLALSFSALPVLAYTECPPAQVVRVWVDVTGNAEVGFSSGMVLITNVAQTGTKNLIAVATAAMLSGKNVIFRIQADGVSCGGGNRSDWWGIHMVNT
jgi:hypothetical protein